MSEGEPASREGGMAALDLLSPSAMTPEIALLLAQDGISTGAIYVLVALGIVLIFLVTRVIFVPFGDVVGYSALTSRPCNCGKCQARSGWCLPSPRLRP